MNVIKFKTNINQPSLIATKHCVQVVKQNQVMLIFQYSNSPCHLLYVVYTHCTVGLGKVQSGLGYVVGMKAFFIVFMTPKEKGHLSKLLLCAFSTIYVICNTYKQTIYSMYVCFKRKTNFAEASKIKLEQEME